MSTTIDALPLSWPPDFIIKEHPRAKNVKLKVSLKNGLEFVVPKRFNQQAIPQLLEQHRKWIEKQLLKISAEKYANQHDFLPREINLPAIQQHWKIDYIGMTEQKKFRLVFRPHNDIALIGNINNKLACKKLLITLLKNIARQFLPKQLAEVSEQIQLPYSSVTIRNQSTRWGSCSSAKTINLNYQLLFFSPELARHVMIHELCHTKHMNHSDKFWNLVAKFDSNWQVNDRLLRKGKEFIPLWIREI